MMSNTRDQVKVKEKVQARATAKGLEVLRAAATKANAR
jgi:hypothetical protein